MARTYQFIVELEDDPITAFTPTEIEEIKNHIADAMNDGIELFSSNQTMYLANAFEIKVIVKD